jgi:PHD/YefM family antitoxin component YafN of YafNO toxin-antitoxin module
MNEPGTITRWGVRSEELRRNLRHLLDSVDREDAHVTIKRYDEAVAVVVPKSWYDTVIDYIGATTFTSEAAAFYARQNETAQTTESEK